MVACESLTPACDGASGCDLRRTSPSCRVVDPMGRGPALLLHHYYLVAVDVKIFIEPSQGGMDEWRS